MAAALNAWMNGQLVGTWTVERGVHAFRYASEWLQSPQARSLSLSLPMTASGELRGAAVVNYFDNLLPDSPHIRQRLARRFKTSRADTFSLLEAIGRDCVGAVQLLPDDTTPQGWNRVDAEPLDDDPIAAILRAVPADPALGALDPGDNFRISIAGAQEKTAFARVGDRWCRPNGATPSTHIFKLPLGRVGGSRRVDLSDSVQNEWLCAQIIAELGLPVASTQIAQFGDSAPVLVVERFDRQWMDSGRWIARLPQEDFCQALGYSPDQKYEADGGPSMAKCLQLLAASSHAPQDTHTFLLTQLAFWLMAATDGHAKNYSIFIQPSDRFVMTPLYDVLSMWPYFGSGPNQFVRRQAGLAMAMRSKHTHYKLDTIQTRHWHGLAMPHGGQPVWQAMLALVDSVGPALDVVQSRLPKDFNAKLWVAISQGMRIQAQGFIAGPVELTTSANASESSHQHDDILSKHQDCRNQVLT